MMLRLTIYVALRLYPQLPINVRFALKTTLLPVGGGPDGESPVLIPRGAGVGYSVYHMHRRKSIYGEDANEFRPQRWENSKLDHIGFGFMPFHGGPRICLGSTCDGPISLLRKTTDGLYPQRNLRSWKPLVVSCASSRSFLT